MKIILRFIILITLFNSCSKGNSGTSGSNVTITPPVVTKIFDIGGLIDTVSKTGIVFTSDVQTDGKIIVGGRFHKIRDLIGGYRTSCNNIVRINSDGSTDKTFFYGSGFNNDVVLVKVQSDGKIIVGGDFSTYNGNIVPNLIRLNSDGSIDKTFNLTTSFEPYGRVFSLQPDGKIIGIFKNKGVVQILRLNTDGSTDNSFKYVNTNNFTGTIWGIIRTNNKLLVYGEITKFSGIQKLNLDGTIDTSFKFITTPYGSASIKSLCVQSDGKILVGGMGASLIQLGKMLTRINPDGSTDNTFNVGSGTNNDINSIIQQVDSKILVGGNFSTFNGISKWGIIRLNLDGTLDTSFPDIRGGIQYIHLTDNDRIILNGSFFYEKSSQSIMNFVIFNKDGTLYQ